jgi:membrane associated rhomboid family serine protease
MVAIVVLNVLVFVYELSLGRLIEPWMQTWGVIPTELLRGRGAVTLITSMFIHGGFLHIGSNMLFLWVFGDNVEDALGHGGFLVFYLAAGIIAGLTHTFVNAASEVPSVGASGAIAGVLGAYLLLFPDAKVRTLLFLGPFFTLARIPAVLMIGFWFVTQLITGLVALEVETASGGVAVWAHIGGFLAGGFVGIVRRGSTAATRQQAP